MISEDLDRKRRTLEKVSPGLKPMNECKEFLVVDVVVPFCRGE